MNGSLKNCCDRGILFVNMLNKERSNCEHRMEVIQLQDRHFNDMGEQNCTVLRVRFAIDPEGEMSRELVLCFYWHKCSAKA